jgi:hypothetical protein
MGEAVCDRCKKPGIVGHLKEIGLVFVEVEGIEHKVLLCETCYTAGSKALKCKCINRYRHKKDEPCPICGVKESGL